MLLAMSKVYTVLMIPESIYNSSTNLFFWTPDLYFFFFLAALRLLEDLGSLTKDRTCTTSSENTES